jgi:SAM-dependent methyltransferase
MDLRLSGSIARRLLDRLSRGRFAPEAWDDRGVNPDVGGWNKLNKHFGPKFLDLARDLHVAEYGSANGLEIIAVAEVATLAVGFEVRQQDIARARAFAETSPHRDRIRFVSPGDGNSVEPNSFDLIYSIDTMEHFADPAGVLRQMRDQLRPNGRVMLSFGPPWYHPYGAHVFDVTKVPWVHLIFRDEVVLDKYNHTLDRHATCYEEVSDGMNRMTIGKFRRLVKDAGFRIGELRAVPIRKARLFQPLLPEFLTSSVHALLYNQKGWSPRQLPEAGPPVDHLGYAAHEPDDDTAARFKG